MACFLDVWPFYIPSLWLQEVVESLSCSECRLRYFPFLLDVLHQGGRCLPGLSLTAWGTDWVVLGRHLNSDFRGSHACLWNGAWHTDTLTGVSSGVRPVSHWCETHTLVVCLPFLLLTGCSAALCTGGGANQSSGRKESHRGSWSRPPPHDGMVYDVG